MKELFETINEYPFTTFCIAIFILILVDLLIDIVRDKK